MLDKLAKCGYLDRLVFKDSDKAWKIGSGRVICHFYF